MWWFKRGTFRRIRDDYVCHNRTNVLGIGKIVRKFEETRYVTDVVRHMHHSNVHTAENIASVLESMADNPNFSISQRSH